mgnify:CR=1 FL=1
MNAARDMYNRCKNRIKRLETKYKAKDVSGVTEAATAADESLKQAGELIAAQSEDLHPTKVTPPSALPSKPPVTEAATAADEPPLEPPGLRSGSQGLRHGPVSSGSVDGVMPNSGVAVLPNIFTPARLKRFTYSESSEGT